LFRIYNAGAGGGPFSICVIESAGIPPCDPYAPEPANSMNPCPSLSTICKVDGFCGTTRGCHPVPGGPVTEYSIDTWPELRDELCGSVENNSFMQFTAADSNVGLRIYGSCISGLGIQMMVFELLNPPITGGCEGGAINSVGCFSLIRLNPSPSQGVPISFTGMTPGSTYYMMIDGYSRAFCDYQVGADYGVQLSVSVSPKNVEICLGNTVQLTAEGGDSSYVWNNSPDLSATSGSIVNFTPSSSGVIEYVVHSQGPSQNCPSSSDTARITVKSPPVPYAGQTDSICLGDTVFLQGTPGSSMNNLLWSVDVSGANGSPFVNWFPNGMVKDPNVKVNEQGTYKFILRETNQLCGVFIDTVDIKVIDQVLTTSSTKPICLGSHDGIVEIFDQDASRYGFDDGFSWGLQSRVDTLSSGLYKVCSKNYLGCSVCSDVIEEEGPEVILSVSEDTVICENGSAVLRARINITNPFHYIWSPTGDSLSTQTVSPMTSGFYTVYADNGMECKTLLDSMYIEVRPPLELTSPIDTAICYGETTNLWAAVQSGGGGPYSFLWSSGDFTPSVYSDQKSFQPDSSSSYTVTVKDNCETSPVTKEIEVNVHHLPIPQFKLLFDSVCEPGDLEIELISPTNSYENSFWTISNGETIQNVDFLSLGNFPAGLYDVQLDLVNKEGCFNSLSKNGVFNVFPIPEANFIANPHTLTVQK
jgi:hypothetical protein